MSLDKDALLARMRDIESQLYSQDAELKVKEEGGEAVQQFVAERASFTAAIASLQASGYRDIANDMAQHGPKLEQTTDQLKRDLGSLENTAAWAGAINGVLGTLGKVIPLV